MYRPSPIQRLWCINHQINIPFSTSKPYLPFFSSPLQPHLRSAAPSPPLLLLPLPASPQMRRPLTSLRLHGRPKPPAVHPSTTPATSPLPHEDPSPARRQRAGAAWSRYHAKLLPQSMDPGARSTDPSCYHAWPRRAGRCCAWSSRCLFPVAVQPYRCSAAVEGIGPGALSTLLPRLRGHAACRRRPAASILKRSSPLSGSR